MSSRVAEIARDEAEQAEQESPDTPETPESPETPEVPETSPEQPEQPEQPQEPAQQGAPPPTPEAAQANMKKWERQRDSHMRELRKRDEYRYEQSVMCPACEGFGLLFPVLPEPEQSIRLQAVTMALGGQAPVELLDDPDTEACERCGANGMLKTHSNVQGQEKRVCTACNGQGWKPKIAQPQVFAPAPPPLAAPQPFAGVSPNGQVPDQWGRAPGQERYGQHPSIGGW